LLGNQFVVLVYEVIGMRSYEYIKGKLQLRGHQWLLLFKRHSFCMFALADMKRSSVDLNITLDVSFFAFFLNL
jgi:hypothetical protein